MKPTRHYPSDGIVDVPAFSMKPDYGYSEKLQMRWQGIVVRLVLAVPLLICGVIAMFFGILLPSGFGGILMVFAVANIGLGLGVVLKRTEGWTWFFSVFGILLLVIDVAILTSNLPTK